MNTSNEIEGGIVQNQILRMLSYINQEKSRDERVILPLIKSCKLYLMCS